VYAIYSLFLSFALLVAIPLYFVKLRIMRKESLHLHYRLGFKVPKRKTQGPFLWIHAVSVGEVLSLQNLIRKIKAAHPDWEVGFSALTNTGYRVAAAKLLEADHLFFIPFDFAGIVRRFLKRLNPNLLVLTESEFWPRLLREARRRACPVLLANGRISNRSFRKFSRFRKLAGILLGNITRFLVQTAGDKERLEKIGVNPELVMVSGNLKCETRLPVFENKDIQKLKKDLSISEGKKVVVAGSIHKGEDDRLFRAFREARRTEKDILLVLAPRHPEKFDKENKAFWNDSFVVRRKTQLRGGQSWDILILDTIGELARFYARSDVAFIGGSLVSHGGQNLLEPAFYGKPIFFGPHMENFAALAEKFVLSGAAKFIETQDDLTSMFLLKDPEALKRMGERAKEALASLQGATEKTLSAIESLMAHGD
jgi:3-deoxy-D-manno-octulosonic-acid transferase